MIIIGYQGIGKSTLASNNTSYIDLESGCFWYEDPITGLRSRDGHWFILYCNVAQHLSEQGYDVFVSSHEEVRHELRDRGCDICAIVPSVELKDEWIEKLHQRYQKTGLSKDFVAWKNAEDRYEANIREIIYDIPNTIQLKSMNYDLLFAIVQARSNSVVLARKSYISEISDENVSITGLNPATGEWGHNA